MNNINLGVVIMYTFSVIFAVVSMYGIIKLTRPFSSKD